MYVEYNECLHANFTVPLHNEPVSPLNSASRRAQYENYLHPGCDIAKFGTWIPTFQKKLLLLSSG
jgi:hypothetical protein